MLSGEGNAGERWKTAIGLISKKATLHVQHTFFVHFFAVVLHDYNVKLPKTSVLQGKTTMRNCTPRDHTEPAKSEEPKKMTVFITNSFG